MGCNIALWSYQSHSLSRLWSDEGASLVVKHLLSGNMRSIGVMCIGMHNVPGTCLTCMPVEYSPVLIT